MDRTLIDYDDDKKAAAALLIERKEGVSDRSHGSRTVSLQVRVIVSEREVVFCGPTKKFLISTQQRASSCAGSL